MCARVGAHSCMYARNARYEHAHYARALCNNPASRVIGWTLGVTPPQHNAVTPGVGLTAFIHSKSALYANEISWQRGVFEILKIRTGIEPVPHMHAHMCVRICMAHMCVRICMRICVCAYAWRICVCAYACALARCGAHLHAPHRPLGTTERRRKLLGLGRHSAAYLSATRPSYLGRISYFGVSGA